MSPVVTRAFAVVLLASACGPSPATSSTSSTTDGAPDSSRVPDTVATTVAAGSTTRVLVVLDREALAPVNAVQSFLSTAQATERTVQFAGAKQDLFASGPDGLELLQDFEQLPIAFAELRSPEALAHLLADPRVLRVVPDLVYTTTLAQSLPLINQAAAAAEGKDGTGTSIAVLDTGADYRVADLGSCTAVGTPASCRVVYAQDFAVPDGLLDDNVKHGTNTASISAAVAPGAKIIALDVFDGQGASTSTIVNAINWVIANRNTYHIASMNLSLGGGSFTSNCDSDAMAIAIAEARNVGVLSAVATGNSGTLNAISSPACSSAAVSVGAVYDANVGPLNSATCSDPSTVADKVTCFSNASSFQTLLAPGAFITAGGVTMAGTSQATPHVAGAIAVLRSAFPNETPTELVTRLTSTGKRITDTRTGRVVPRLDLAAASAGCVLRVTPTTNTVPSTASSVTLTLATSSSCAWSASASDTWLSTSPASGTGPATITVQAGANASGIRSGTITITGAGGATASATVSQGIDTAAPTGTVVINAGATWTKTATVALAITASDPSGVAGMCVTNGVACTVYEPFDTAKTWTLAATNGPQTVRVFLKDSRGNVTTAATAAADGISLDTGLPTGAAATATYGNGQVALAWTIGADALSGLEQYRVVFNEGLTAPATCATGTIAYQGANRTFTHLSLTNGTTYSYRVCAQDKAGNFSIGSVAQAKPRPESAGPVPTLTINQGAVATNSLVVQLNIGATDDSGVAQQCVSTAVLCTAWEPYTPTRSFTLLAKQGAQSIRVLLKDEWGNVSAAAATASIVYDTVAPLGGALTAVAHDQSTTLTWTAATDATSGIAGYRLAYQAGTVAPTSCAGGTSLGFTTSLTFTHTGLTNGSTLAYRVCAVDKAGNVALGLIASTMPKPEAVGPVGSITINGGATVTRVPSVTLGLSAVDDSQVVSMCVSSTGVCTAWETPAATKTFVLPNTQGARRVYVSFKDEWGNVSATPASASILFDTVAPVGGTLTATYGDASNTLSWTAAADVTSGVASYTLVYATGLTAPASCAVGTNLGSLTGTTFVHTGLTNGTTYSYRLCAVDQAGNIAVGVIASKAPKPEAIGPVGSITLNGGAAWSKSASVTATLAATDASTVSQMCLATSAAACAAWVAFATRAIVALPSTPGQKTVFAYFKDQWGNVSAAAATDTIGLDFTSPTQPVLSATPGSASVTLSWPDAVDVTSGVAGYKLVVLPGAALPPAGCAVGTLLTSSGTSFTHDSLTSGAAYSYRLCSVDVAGNTSIGSTAIVRAQ